VQGTNTITLQTQKRRCQYTGSCLSPPTPWNRNVFS